MIHKWAGLVLGIQLVLWLTGGFVMSVIPGDKVHGDHLVNREHSKDLPRSAYQYPIESLLEKVSGNIKSISYSSLLQQPVYKVRTGKGQQWFNAVTGDAVAKLSEAQIRELAQGYYVGDGALASLNFLEQLPQEMGRRKNLWQATFDDMVDTTLYLSPDTGSLVRVRSDIWRVYDFFWMLHIMDYTERSDSHNWMLIIFAAFGTLFSLTGVILFFQVFKKRDFVWKKRRALRPLQD
ncbi:MAG: PepSY domain-containing protein [Psychrosphaera sp.]|nr:PepSY domain-containing protein [Psychrosphaera sp.]